MPKKGPLHDTLAKIRATRSAPGMDVELVVPPDGEPIDARMAHLLGKSAAFEVVEGQLDEVRKKLLTWVGGGILVVSAALVTFGVKLGDYQAQFRDMRARIEKLEAINEARVKVDAKIDLLYSRLSQKKD